MEDGISRAMKLILADDRRRPDDEEAVAKHWRHEFSAVSGDALVSAVGVWLRENPRGRPNVGKVWEILNRSKPAVDRRRDEWDEERRRELRWAVSILEDPSKYREYQATLGYAERCLRAQGYGTWQAAKSFLEPGWVSNPPREAYL